MSALKKDPKVKLIQEKKETFKELGTLLVK